MAESLHKRDAHDQPLTSSDVGDELIMHSPIASPIRDESVRYNRTPKSASRSYASPKTFSPSDVRSKVVEVRESVARILDESVKHPFIDPISKTLTSKANNADGSSGGNNNDTVSNLATAMFFTLPERLRWTEVQLMLSRKDQETLKQRLKCAREEIMGLERVVALKDADVQGCHASESEFCDLLAAERRHNAVLTDQVQQLKSILRSERAIARAETHRLALSLMSLEKDKSQVEALVAPVERERERLSRENNDLLCEQREWLEQFLDARDADDEAREAALEEQRVIMTLQSIIASEEEQYRDRSICGWIGASATSSRQGSVARQPQEEPSPQDDAAVISVAPESVAFDSRDLAREHQRLLRRYTELELLHRSALDRQGLVDGELKSLRTENQQLKMRVHDSDQRCQRLELECTDLGLAKSLLEERRRSEGTGRAASDGATPCRPLGVLCGSASRSVQTSVSSMSSVALPQQLQQIAAERNDLRLALISAEGRARAAESKVALLEGRIDMDRNIKDAMASHIGSGGRTVKLPTSAAGEDASVILLEEQSKLTARVRIVEKANASLKVEVQRLELELKKQTRMTEIFRATASELQERQEMVGITASQEEQKAKESPTDKQLRLELGRLTTEVTSEQVRNSELQSQCAALTSELECTKALLEQERVNYQHLLQQSELAEEIQRRADGIRFVNQSNVEIKEASLVDLSQRCAVLETLLSESCAILSIGVSPTEQKSQGEREVPVESVTELAWRCQRQLSELEERIGALRDAVRYFAGRLGVIKRRQSEGIVEISPRLTASPAAIDEVNRVVEVADVLVAADTSEPTPFEALEATWSWIEQRLA